ncbi:MAG TPA: penicillin-binding transpeptidase domain-containing protein [Candidatus Pacearchaeota archaeon]|nr:penicillin-binding transpeptidase domain-containing protein [Candidatus Pacearchaeota archaeon]HOK94025.1 penicillin-binding transpeptidase domain-containing protein [Candidatus Pacearchaeota archaeon]HPO75096.1 penicillin-binding transpeptidase domain-containing protein [Candidatus Pacearchaeota archaeon]
MAHYKVKTQFKEELEPEEILLDSEEKKKKDKGRLEVPIQNSVFSLIFLLLLFLLFVLFARSFYLMAAEGDKYTQMAINNYLWVFKTDAPRGKIYSSDGILLADNVEKEVTKTDVLGNEILTKEYTRAYIDGPVFAHILGYVNFVSPDDLEADSYYQRNDRIGRNGIESEYEKELRGTKGRIEKTKNAQGKFIEGSEKIINEPIQGNSLVLNINAGLQKKLYETIKEKVPDKNASAIALDPQTGKVLALVSIPSYDNNSISPTQGSFFNRAIKGKYPSGSIIKPLIAAAGLEEGVITPQTKINCQGKILIPGTSVFKKDWKTHGITDLNKALAESCNIYFFSVGGGGYGDIQGLGIQKIKKYLDLFYLEEKLGIDLPGEEVGFVPTEEWFDENRAENEKRSWSIDDVYNVSIGQGFFETTPLHIAVALSTIANGGKIYQPQIVDKITTPDEKEIIEDIQPKVLNENFISSENITAVKEGMRQCVVSPTGSCRQLLSLPVTSAGKTGTAETPGNQEPHSWFVSFAPYENPEIFLLVMVENGGGGEKVAEPIAKEVLKWYFSQK